MKMIKAVMVAVLMGFAAMAQAGFYAGVGAGVADKDLGPAPAALGPDYGTDSSSTAYKGFVGYSAGPAGIEASYVDLGEYGFTSTAGDVMREIDGVGLALVGFVPLVDDLRLTLKVGAFEASGGTLATATTGGNGNDGTNAFYGVGLESRLAPRILVRGEYERFDEVDVDLVSISLGVGF